MGSDSVRDVDGQNEKGIIASRFHLIERAPRKNIAIIRNFT